MSNYTPITDFSAKDALSTGNPSKVILGSEVDAEFDAISTAVATKIDSINSLNAETALDTGDTMVFYDSSAGTHKKITEDNLRFDLNGGWVWLETETASNSPTLDFTLDTTNYTQFMIKFDNLKPATDAAELWGRLSTDGVTYATTAYRWARHNVTDAASEGLAGSTNDAKFLMANAVGNQDGEQVCGTIDITSVGAMGVRVQWRLSGENAAGSYYMINGMGAYVAAASTYFRFLFSTGNITSGTARLYGLKKT